jgi:hypothetical protein
MIPNDRWGLAGFAFVAITCLALFALRLRG